MGKSMTKHDFGDFVETMKVGDAIDVIGENGTTIMVAMVDICDSIGCLVGGYNMGIESFSIYDDSCDVKEFSRLIDFVFEILESNNGNVEIAKENRVEFIVR